MKLDEWQQEVLETKGHLCLRSGRQVGKSTVVSIKAGQYAIKNKNKVILVIAAVERQAYHLFEKILTFLMKDYNSYIKKGKDRPTKSKIRLTNGSIIYCLPTGMTGLGIRGYTVDLLIADEAAFIPEEVWGAVTPMLAATGGDIILLSTPHLKEGYYYNCFQDPSFTKFHVSSEDCPRITKEYLEHQKKTRTILFYTKEFLGEFVDELKQFFSTELIKKCMNMISPTATNRADNFLGVDVAGMGEDQTVLFALRRIRREFLEQLSLEVHTRTAIPTVSKIIKYSDARHNYKKIYIDTGGLGVGVFELLREDMKTKRKVVSIDNATKGLDYEGKRRKKLLKEDLYVNLKVLMEQGNISLKKNDDTYMSLRSIQYEDLETGGFKIYGKYSHITEALIRAAWCIKDKALNIWFDYS
jgi:hypothetical protein